MKKTKNVISYSVAHAQAIAPWFILNYIQKNIDANAGECLKEGIDVICIGSWLRENHTTSWYVSDLVELDRCPKHVNPLVRRDFEMQYHLLDDSDNILGIRLSMDYRQLPATIWRVELWLRSKTRPLAEFMADGIEYPSDNNEFAVNGLFPSSVIAVFIKSGGSICVVRESSTLAAGILSMAAWTFGERTAK